MRLQFGLIVFVVIVLVIEHVTSFQHSTCSHSLPIFKIQSTHSQEQEQQILIKRRLRILNVCPKATPNLISEENRNENFTESLGPFQSIAKWLDDSTNGFAFSYVDTHPYTEKSPIGILFLLTNLVYTFSSIFIMQNNNFVYGLVIECAGAVSFCYHYLQLHLGPDRKDVKLALVLDYLVAFATIMFTTYQVSSFIFLYHTLPLGSISLASISIIFLIWCWQGSCGLSYIVLHSLWHIFSALATVEIAREMMAVSSV